MEPELVEDLEEELEAVILQALQRLGKNRLPHPPTPRLAHLMAKAAVTVYEAVSMRPSDEKRPR